MSADRAGAAAYVGLLLDQGFDTQAPGSPTRRLLGEQMEELLSAPDLEPLVEGLGSLAWYLLEILGREGTHPLTAQETFAAISPGFLTQPDA